jgi:hypothetical protein
VQNCDDTCFRAIDGLRVFGGSRKACRLRKWVVGGYPLKTGTVTGISCVCGSTGARTHERKDGEKLLSHGSPLSMSAALSAGVSGSVSVLTAQIRHMSLRTTAKKT